MLPGNAIHNYKLKILKYKKLNESKVELKTLNSFKFLFDKSIHKVYFCHPFLKRTISLI